MKGAMATIAADKFARETARTAHRNSQRAIRLAEAAVELAQDAGRVTTERHLKFAGLCSLCGDPCAHNARYCRAHEWAA